MPSGAKSSKRTSLPPSLSCAASSERKARSRAARRLWHRQRDSERDLAGSRRVAVGRRKQHADGGILVGDDLDVVETRPAERLRRAVGDEDARGGGRGNLPRGKLDFLPVLRPAQAGGIPVFEQLAIGVPAHDRELRALALAGVEVLGANPARNAVDDTWPQRDFAGRVGVGQMGVGIVVNEGGRSVPALAPDDGVSGGNFPPRPAVLEGEHFRSGAAAEKERGDDMRKDSFHRKMIVKGWKVLVTVSGAEGSLSRLTPSKSKMAIAW